MVGQHEEALVQRHGGPEGERDSFVGSITSIVVPAPKKRIGGAFKLY